MESVRSFRYFLSCFLCDIISRIGTVLRTQLRNHPGGDFSLWLESCPHAQLFIQIAAYSLAGCAAGATNIGYCATRKFSFRRPARNGENQCENHSENPQNFCSQRFFYARIL